jgi:hypothetical protein
LNVLPLPLVEVWEELRAEVERLTGEAGLQILRALLRLLGSGSAPLLNESGVSPSLTGPVLDGANYRQ